MGIDDQKLRVGSINQDSFDSIDSNRSAQFHSDDGDNSVFNEQKEAYERYKTKIKFIDDEEETKEMHAWLVGTRISCIKYHNRIE